jgi:hypothetical protein
MHKFREGTKLPFFEEEDEKLLEEMFEPYPPSSAASSQAPNTETEHPDSNTADRKGEGEEAAYDGQTRRRFNVYPRERPFTRLMSLLTKLPVHKAGLVYQATLDRVYACLCSGSGAFVPALTLK